MVQLYFLPVMSRLKFVKTPTEEIKEQLSEIYHGHSDFAFRKRAHAILLSAKGITISQLQDILEVDRALDPMVSAYFKNIGQTRTLIELLQDRNEIQDSSSEEMRSKFAAYSLELQEVLIGTPRASEEHGKGIEQILMQVRNRQVAVEQVETYKLQEAASVQDAP